MQVACDPAIAGDILGKLKDLNRKSKIVEPFVNDYEIVLRKCRVLEVQVGQLSRESTELREEVLEKEKILAEVAEKVQKIHLVESLAAELKKVKAENNILSQESGKLKSEVACKREELADVVKVGAELGAEVQNLQQQNQDLTTRLETVEKDLEHEKEAREIAVSQYSENKSMLEEAQSRLLELERENLTFVERLKDSSADVERKFNMINEWELQLQQKEEDLKKRSKTVDNVLIAGIRNPLMNMFRKREPRQVDNQEEQSTPQSGSSCASYDFVQMGVDNEVDQPRSKECNVPRTEFAAPQAHNSSCTSVAFSPTNPSCVATSGQGGAINLWNPETRVLQRKLYEQMDGGLMDLAFTCNGERILAAGQDKSIRVWSLQGNQTVMRGHDRGVNCVVGSPADASRGASTGEDKRIILWDVARGIQLSSQISGSTPNAVCFTQEGNVIISGHANGSVRLWDIRTPDHSLNSASDGTKKFHEGTVAAVACFPTRQAMLLTAGKDNRLHMSDIRKPGGIAVVQSFSSPDFALGTIGYMGKGRCVIGISPDDKYIVAGSAQGKVFVWETTKDKGECPEVLRSKGHKNSIVACAWSPHWENRVVSCDKDGVVVFWEYSIEHQRSSSM